MKNKAHRKIIVGKIEKLGWTVYKARLSNGMIVPEIHQTPDGKPLYHRLFGKISREASFDTLATICVNGAVKRYQDMTRKGIGDRPAYVAGSMSLHNIDISDVASGKRPKLMEKVDVGPVSILRMFRDGKQFAEVHRFNGRNVFFQERITKGVTFKDAARSVLQKAGAL